MVQSDSHIFIKPNIVILIQKFIAKSTISHNYITKPKMATI